MMKATNTTLYLTLIVKHTIQHYRINCVCFIRGEFFCNASEKKFDFLPVLFAAILWDIKVTYE